MNHPNPKPIIKRFFSYDPDMYGLDFFDTAERARRHASETLDSYRKESGEGWHEDTSAIVWGMVLGEAQGFPVDPPEHDCDENGVYSGDFDEYLDFAIVEPAPTLAQIEAFPDMLAALEALTPLAENNTDDTEKWQRAISAAKAAIAKAKGGVE